jgi:hypothetical protein
MVIPMEPVDPSGRWVGVIRPKTPAAYDMDHVTPQFRFSIDGPEQRRSLSSVCICRGSRAKASRAFILGGTH